MPRIKPRNSIKTRDQAEAAVSRINSIDMKHATQDLSEAEAVASVRDTHAERQNQDGRLKEEIEKSLLVKELKSWAETDVETWKDKSLEFKLGKIGFRMSNPAVKAYKTIAKNFEIALEKLADRMPKYTRMTASIDKDKILADKKDKTLDIAKLRRCGLQVEQKEEFWVETQASVELVKAAKALKAA